MTGLARPWRWREADTVALLADRGHPWLKDRGVFLPGAVAGGDTLHVTLHLPAGEYLLYDRFDSRVGGLTNETVLQWTRAFGRR